MYTMKEVVGVSPDGFSEAVRNAVNQVIKTGDTVHWFEVLEQRGGVRNGQFSEYQVKISVAVSAGEKSANIQKTQQIKTDERLCSTCGKPAGEHGHMCAPFNADENYTCDWCGAVIPEEQHMCDDKIKEVSYICNSCGRMAVNPDYLCQPQKAIKK